MVNIISFSFNNLCSVITAKLQTSCSQNNAMIQYNINTDNIIPCHIFKILLPRAIKEQLAAKKSRSIILKTNNKTTILQLGFYSITINHKNRHKLCKIFVVQGHGLVFLGMPEIEALDTIDMQTSSEQVSKSRKTVGIIQTRNRILKHSCSTIQTVRVLEVIRQIKDNNNNKKISSF